VTQVVGLLIESAGPTVSLGDFCRIETGVKEKQFCLPREDTAFSS